LGVAAQILGVELGVEVIRITQVRRRRARHPRIGKTETILLGDDFGQAVLADPVRMPVCATMQPILMKIEPVDVDAVKAEGMKVTRAGSRPVDELDAELEGRLGGAHERGFDDAQEQIELQHVGNRRFPDADDADLFRLDERERNIVRFEHARQGRRRHPAGGAAAYDDDALQPPLHGARSSAKRRVRPACAERTRGGHA